MGRGAEARGTSSCCCAPSGGSSPPGPEGAGPRSNAARKLEGSNFTYCPAVIDNYYHRGAVGEVGFCDYYPRLAGRAGHCSEHTRASGALASGRGALGCAGFRGAGCCCPRHGGAHVARPPTPPQGWHDAARVGTRPALPGAFWCARVRSPRHAGARWGTLGHAPWPRPQSRPVPPYPAPGPSWGNGGPRRWVYRSVKVDGRGRGSRPQGQCLAGVQLGQSTSSCALGSAPNRTETDLNRPAPRCCSWGARVGVCAGLRRSGLGGGARARDGGCRMAQHRGPRGGRIWWFLAEPTPCTRALELQHLPLQRLRRPGPAVYARTRGAR